jgi:hypothetical protein
MLGSAIVFIPELPKDVSNLFERITENEEFEKIELDGLTSIDFSVITEENNTSWESDNNPIVFDEEGGLVITHISKIGLVSVLEFKGELDDVEIETQNSDMQQLKAFTDKFGFDHLYELVTF